VILISLRGTQFGKYFDEYFCKKLVNPLLEENNGLIKKQTSGQIKKSN
jgi:hypothetical protein